MVDTIKNSRFLKILLYLWVLALFFFLSSIVFHVYTSRNRLVDVEELTVDQATIGVDLQEVTPPQDEYNVLLLGHGDPGHPGGDLADTLMVVRLDTKEKKVALISVPRDTWLSIRLNNDQVESHKINEIYLVGKKYQDEEYGFQLIKQAVGQVIGLPIHHYVFVSFGKFMEIVDTLGGIETEVPVTFDDYFYPVRGRELELCGWSPEEVTAMTATMSGFALEKQFSCRYEHLHFEKGETKMNGETALKFVRSRHSDQHGGDFARAERQQAVVAGMADRLLALDVLEKIPELYGDLRVMVKTDFDLEIAKQVGKLLINPESYQQINVTLSTENVFDASRNSGGQFILVPKEGFNQWSQVHRLVETELQGSALLKSD